MRLRRKLLAVAAALPLMAGGFVLQIGKPSANPEAVAKNAVLVVHGYACAEQEKTRVSGTAEGIVDGKRESVALKLIPISGQGMYAVARQWPNDGRWVLAFTMTNPRFGQQSAVLKVDGGTVDWAGISRFNRATATEDIEAALGAPIHTADAAR